MQHKDLVLLEQLIEYEEAIERLGFDVLVNFTHRTITIQTCDDKVFDVHVERHPNFIESTLTFMRDKFDKLRVKKDNRLITILGQFDEIGKEAIREGEWVMPAKENTYITHLVQSDRVSPRRTAWHDTTLYTYTASNSTKVDVDTKVMDRLLYK